MNTITPKLTDDGFTFFIEVNNQFVEADMRKKKSSIEQHFRTTLSNRKITMDIRTVLTKAPARLLSPREQYEKMKSENVHLQTMMKVFDLDLI